MAITRFAPSPNGPLHLGHAWSAIIAHDLAQGRDGRFLLRIEDIDGARSKPALADEFRLDLAWLGLEWEEVPAQSTRLHRYDAATAELARRGLLYPCTCTRRDIAASSPGMGPDGWIYPGTCKGRQPAEGKPFSLRLDLDKAMAQAGELRWVDELAGEQMADPRPFGDVVLVRKDEPASYHLAATLDDAADGVTLVTRGRDLFHATPIHRLLQALLDLPQPTWHHHTLLLDQDGKKLAKRRGSTSLASLRNGGADGRALAERLRRGVLPAGITCTNP